MEQKQLHMYFKYIIPEELGIHTIYLCFMYLLYSGYNVYIFIHNYILTKSKRGT